MALNSVANQNTEAGFMFHKKMIKKPGAFQILALFSVLNVHFW